MHVDPLSSTRSSPSVSSTPTTSPTATPNPVSTLGITTIAELTAYLQAGGTLTEEQKRNIMQSIQAQMSQAQTQVAAADSQIQEATHEMDNIDLRAEFQTHGLRNIRVCEGGVYKKINPNTITLAEAKRHLRNMAFISEDGVVKPVSEEAARSLPPIGSVVEIENPDGTKSRITVTRHLLPMTKEQFQELEVHLLSHVGWCIQNRTSTESQGTATPERPRIEEQLYTSTFHPRENVRSFHRQPPETFYNNVVTTVRAEETRRHQQEADEQLHADEHRQERRERVRTHREHLELVENQRAEDISRDNV